MAYILFTRLCREVETDEQTGKDLLMGEFDKLPWVNADVGFVLAVYWLGYIGESFSLSYALIDEADHILARPLRTECEFTSEEINVSLVNFYAAFSHPGAYHINIYQNGLCAKILPLEVIEAQRTLVNK